MSFAARLAATSILIVEDEAIIALGLCDMLADVGVGKVAVATSVTEARTVSDVGSFDAAILDVRLRDGTSRDVAHALHNAGIALVIHSGHARADDLAQDFPPAVLCKKPADFNTLVGALSEALEAKTGVSQQV